MPKVNHHEYLGLNFDLIGLFEVLDALAVGSEKFISSRVSLLLTYVLYTMK